MNKKLIASTSIHLSSPRGQGSRILIKLDSWPSGNDTSWIYRGAILAILLCICVIAPTTARAANPQLADCKSLNKFSKKESFRPDPKIIKQCGNRGGDPPQAWIDDKPATVGGAKGFSYSAVHSPKDSPGARNADASVTADVIEKSCNFPPQVTFGFPPKVNFAKGSCLDFRNDLFKDKNGSKKSNNPPPVVSPNDKCPALSDAGKVYGEKTALTGGKPITATCGGAIPTTTSDMVLNVNPDGFATTEAGAYYVWFYKKSGSSYAGTGQAIQLPRYLCTNTGSPEGNFRQKTVDLTPPVAQMITYRADAGAISIRLKSRATMGAGFIPEYNPEDPEKYLVIPVDGAGNLQVPSDCSEETTYFRTLSTRQDILITSQAGDGCEAFSITPTTTNEPTFECPAGSTLSQNGKCFDINGKEVQKVTVNHWKLKCPGGIAPVNDKCPEDALVPPEARCATGGTATDDSCNLLTISINGASCKGKTQYALRNRPNLYFPPETTIATHPIAGRTTLLVDTVANTKLYAQRQTSFYLQPTAPEITFNDGGTIDLKNGNKIIMKSPAIVKGNSITFINGGHIVSSGGTQLQQFAKNATYSIPADLLVLPIEINSVNSVLLPAGLSIPTAPKIGTRDPYFWQPVSK